MEATASPSLHVDVAPSSRSDAAGAGEHECCACCARALPALPACCESRVRAALAAARFFWRACCAPLARDALFLLF